MGQFYSNGKLLLTGEYVVLDGATALAVPTRFGQDLIVDRIQGDQLIWSSFTVEDICWFEAVFDLPRIRLANATFTSDHEGSQELVAEILQGILQEAQRLNPNFLGSDKGFRVKTHLQFPRSWGLGSSSTLINNIAQWARVDAFSLLWNAFSGSGYDIACARNDMPVFYTMNDRKPKIDTTYFDPPFKEQLYFVHLNQKQNSRDGIRRYQERRSSSHSSFAAYILRISNISQEMVKTDSLSDFEKLIAEHEAMIASMIGLPRIKDVFFADYASEIKSLGAWGGDFVLATGDSSTPEYFRQKGFDTILTYAEMILGHDGS